MLIPIVYQDDDLIVIDKPAGIASHASESWKGQDVYHLLIEQGVEINTSGDDFRQGIVSRLDVGTSGLMVVAKNEQSYQKLKEMFKQHLVKKTYLALVTGKVKIAKGTINAPIGRHPSRKKRALFAVVDGGKPAITHFDVCKNLTDKTLLKINLQTGRTHQIRVHLSAYGHPLVGDVNYGGPEFDGLNHPWLHSWQLDFSHPLTEKQLHFESKIPEELLAVLI
ncbi:MAG: RluA family pseudouridine synthase [Candidatus Ancillula sp.]|nr:RluA family pseudouridine synthase [Candidatus Ancillula sp.]